MSDRIAFLVMTTRCNRRCPYCFYETGYQNRKDPDLRLEVNKGFLDALRAAGIHTLIFTGGDPLLLPDIAGAVGLAVQAGFRTLLLSNGDGLGGDMLDRLLATGLHGISLSMDGLAAEETVKAPWPALERIAGVAGLSGAVITPVTRKNLGEIPEIVQRISGLSLYLLLQPVFIPADSPLHTRYSLAGCTPHEQAQFTEGIRSWVAAFGESPYADLLLRFYAREEADPRPHECLMGTDSLVIDANGDVMPCFHRPDLIAGNIHQEAAVSLYLKAFSLGPGLRRGSCFGEHCLSLFSHL